MVKRIIKMFFIGVVLFLITQFFTITPIWHYYIGKDKRLEIIKKLTENCVEGDTTYLILTYRDIYWDSNTSNCWSEFSSQCFYNKEKNLTLKLPINCKRY